MGDITLKNKEKWIEGSDRHYVDRLLFDRIETPILVEFISTEGIVGIFVELELPSEFDNNRLDILEKNLQIPGNIKVARKWFINNYYTEIYGPTSSRIYALGSVVENTLEMMI